MISALFSLDCRGAFRKCLRSRVETAAQINAVCNKEQTYSMREGGIGHIEQIEGRRRGFSDRHTIFFLFLSINNIFSKIEAPKEVKQ